MSGFLLHGCLLLLRLHVKKAWDTSTSQLGVVALPDRSHIELPEAPLSTAPP